MYKTNAGAGDFTPVPAGSHIAVCDTVADIGLQPGSQLFPKPKQQVYIRFELPNERIDFEKDGKKQEGPCVIGKTYTASMNEKANLRHHLESWRGKAFTDEEAEAFDVSAILGKPCMLTVMHTQKDGKTYANITGIGPLPKGISAKTIIPEITPVLYAQPDNTSTYQALPEWLRKKIDGQILPDKPSDAGNQLEDGSYITDADLPADAFDDDQSVPF
jgi:hypothetical protein